MIFGYAYFDVPFSWPAIMKPIRPDPALPLYLPSATKFATLCQIIAMEIQALIVDDEFQSRNFLSKTLARLHPEIEVVGTAGTVDEAVDKIRELKPNLLFLDIMIQNRNGFEVFDHIKEVAFEIIFTTAHNEFAVKAFRFNAVDYLLKPIDIDELEIAIARVRERLGSARTTTLQQVENLAQQVRYRENALTKIAIPTTDGFILVALETIIYCESDGNYTNFILKDNKKITSSYTLKQYEEMLSGSNFFRTHKSYLVNVGHITRYIKGDGGIVIMSNGNELEVSRNNKQPLLDLIRV
jgi:two-component system, LytTR family, response regulator